MKLCLQEECASWPYIELVHFLISVVVNVFSYMSVDEGSFLKDQFKFNVFNPSPSNVSPSVKGPYSNVI